MTTAGRAPTRAPSLARRVVAYELGMWRSLFRWVRRRPVAPGVEAFSYAGAVTPVMWAFIGVSAVEIPAVHLLLPWESVRRLLLAVGIYGLLWMIGMLAGLRVHPHAVDDEGLRVRYGATVDLRIPWSQIAAVRRRLRSHEGVRAVRVSGSGADRLLDVVIANQTNVEVVLVRPLPLLAARGDVEPVGAVRLYADDPGRLVARLRLGAEKRRAGNPGESAR